MTHAARRLHGVASFAVVALGVGAVLLGALGSCGRAGAVPPATELRIVSVGGAVTETVYALGLGASVVAIDTSSMFPPEATRLPHVGYQRLLAAEGVLSQRPTLVLAAHDAGPPAAIQQLRDAGVKVVLIGGDGFDLGSAREKVLQIAAALGQEAAGRALVERMRGETDDALALAGRATSKPRVLFVYARGAGAVQVAGGKNAADAMIRLAGGENAITSFDGFKPLTAEAVALAAPDVILVPARGLDSLGGEDGLLAQPGMALTPAGRSRRVVTVDDVVLLGFGPRIGQGLRELTLGLHPELTEGARR